MRWKNTAKDKEAKRNRQSAQGQAWSGVTLMQRAQVAAILGNDLNKIVRQRLELKAAGKTNHWEIMKPTRAAEKVLLVGDPLIPRNDPLRHDLTRNRWMTLMPR